MATTGIGYRGFDVAVGTQGSTFITRAQSFEVEDTRPSNTAYELGTTEAVGSLLDATRFRGRLTRYSIDDNLEDAFGAGTKTWKAIIEADGISILCSLFGISDAKVTSITYTGRTDGWATETWNFIGSTGSAGAITATTPVSGVAGIRHPKMSVEVNGTPGVRAQGYTIRANVRGNELSELNNSSIVGIVYDQPSVDISVDWVQSTNIAGNTDLAAGAEQDIEVILSDPADAVVKRMTVKDCHTTGITERATVGGWATETINYNSLANDANAGLLVAVA